MMETNRVVCQMKPYIQPFERILALQELEMVSGGTPQLQCQLAPTLVRYEVSSCTPSSVLLGRLAYWESVADPSPRWTRQLLREATTALARNGHAPADLPGCLPFHPQSVPTPNRRCLRYGPHGLHDYRGKYFPQLVRALLNISNVQEGSLVLDPMCGSGTTLVEAALMGCRSVGLDLNPLSVFISQVKCDSLQLAPHELLADYECLVNAISLGRPAYGDRIRWAWLLSLPAADQAYLTRWFPDHVLAELDLIVSCITKCPNHGSRNIFMVTLSDCLRSVSFQKPDDLRIRRSQELVRPRQAISDFMSRLLSNVKHLSAFLLQEQDFDSPTARVIEGDARLLETMIAEPADVVVTSPPYATALPYLDTDRLSLSYLRLLTRTDHRARDYRMIGNREITDKMRLQLWKDFQTDGDEMPNEVKRTVHRLQALYGNGTVGFRRRNLPSLVARYFQDMNLVLAGAFKRLRRGGQAFIVIGDNHTVADGTRIDIKTSELLTVLAQRAGFEVVQLISMEMLPPRDIFSNNSVATEHIIHLARP